MLFTIIKSIPEPALTDFSKTYDHLKCKLIDQKSMGAAMLEQQNDEKKEIVIKR